jgi:hypothetical protein
MKASTAHRQLNIRSNDAYERAHRLARQRGSSVTAVIEQALECYEREARSISPKLSRAQAEENGRALDEARQRMWGENGPPKGLTSDHSWLYDENGLPR